MKRRHDEHLRPRLGATNRSRMDRWRQERTGKHPLQDDGVAVSRIRKRGERRAAAYSASSLCSDRTAVLMQIDQAYPTPASSRSTLSRLKPATAFRSCRVTRLTRDAGRPIRSSTTEPHAIASSTTGVPAAPEASQTRPRNFPPPPHVSANCATRQSRLEICLCRTEGHGHK